MCFRLKQTFAVLAGVSGILAFECTRESISEHNPTFVQLSMTYICRRDMLVMPQDVESHTIFFFGPVVGIQS